MTPQEFKAIRKAARLSTAALARTIGIAEASSIRRYENGSRTISGPVEKLMLQLQAGKLKADTG